MSLNRVCRNKYGFARFSNRHSSPSKQASKCLTETVFNRTGFFVNVLFYRDQKQ